MNSMTGRLAAGCCILHAAGVVYGIYAGGVFLLLAAFGLVMLAALAVILVFAPQPQDDAGAGDRETLHPYRKAFTP